MGLLLLLLLLLLLQAEPCANTSLLICRGPRMYTPTECVPMNTLEQQWT